MVALAGTFSYTGTFSKARKFSYAGTFTQTWTASRIALSSRLKIPPGFWNRTFECVEKAAKHVLSLVGESLYFGDLLKK